MENKKKFIIVFGFLIIFTISLIVIFFLPSFHICRKKLILPFDTGLVSKNYEFGDGKFTAWLTTACVVKVENVSEKETIIKLGYFDKFMRIHTYNARLGGEQSKVGFCPLRPDGTVIKCQTGEPKDVVKNLIIGQTNLFFIVMKDDSGSVLSINEQTLDYSLFIDNFKNALINKDHFPAPSHLLQISQMEYTQ